MKPLLFLSVLVVSSLVSHAQKRFPSFGNGDRICFIGSSIAMNGGCFHYLNLFYTTRYPERKIIFFNGGISGDVSEDILKRLHTDILKNRPTWSVLMLEENDLRPALYYSERQGEPDIARKKAQGLLNWKTNVDSLTRKLLQTGSKVVLQTPTIYDQTGQLSSKNAMGLNDSLQKCVVFLYGLARQYKLPLVDCWTLLNAVNCIIQQQDLTKTIVSNDRVHVGKLGHFVMAYQFLRTQRVQDMVADWKIDAAQKKVVRQTNGSIQKLRVRNGGLSFDLHSKSLPFPAPDGINPDSVVPFTEEFNTELLQIQGLPKSDYQLWIDTMLIGRFSATELAKGINLSRYSSTPQYHQAEEVLRLFYTYWELERALRLLKYVDYVHLAGVFDTGDEKAVEKRFSRILEEAKESPNYSFFQHVFQNYRNSKSKEKALHKQWEELGEAIQQAAQPLKHSYRILPVSPLSSSF